MGDLHSRPIPNKVCAGVRLYLAVVAFPKYASTEEDITRYLTNGVDPVTYYLLWSRVQDPTRLYFSLDRLREICKIADLGDLHVTLVECYFVLGLHTLT
jgi:hypothetical protein